MSLSEVSCYTIINAQETEPYNEMQLKMDLGLLLYELWLWVCR